MPRMNLCAMPNNGAMELLTTLKLCYYYRDSYLIISHGYVTGNTTWLVLVVVLVLLLVACRIRRLLVRIYTHQ